jgi:hypothetical protein
MKGAQCKVDGEKSETARTQRRSLQLRSFLSRGEAVTINGLTETQHITLIDHTFDGCVMINLQPQ